MSFYQERLKLIGDSTQRKGIEHDRVLDGQQPWPYYGSSLDEYNQEYKQVLPPHFRLEELIEEKQRKNGRFVYAEICGDGQMVRDSKLITHGVGLTLFDARTESGVDKDISDGLTVFEGDVLSPASWRLLESYLKTLGAPGFDLMIMRPAGGWFTMGLTTDYYDYFALQYINNCSSLLNPSGGTLFYSLYNLHDGLQRKGHKFKEWMGQIAAGNKRNPDFTVNYSRNRLVYKVERTSAHPIVLPIIGSGG